MKIKGLLAEMIDAVVRHEKKKVQRDKPDYYLNQKKQLWYRMMNTVDGTEPEDEAGAAKPDRD